MNTGDLYLLVWLGVVLLPFLLHVVSFLKSFYTRTDWPMYYTRFFLLKWRFSELERNDDGLAVLLHTALAIITALLLVAIDRLGVFHTIMAGVVLALVLSPRYIIDVCKTLKYNTKTRESDRIANLERELQKLKDK